MKAKIIFLLAGVICVLSVLPAMAADPETEEFSFSRWIGQGLDFLTEQVIIGWDTVSDEAEAGWDLVSEKVSELADTVAVYVKEQQWDKQVEEAWNKLKEAAENNEIIPTEELSEAYQTVRGWFVDHQDEIDQGAAEAVDYLAGAVGVKEAKISAWYRVVERFMTENAPLTTQAVKDAWTTIKESYAEAEPVEREKLEKAFETIRIWMESQSGEDAETASKALDALEENGSEE